MRLRVNILIRLRDFYLMVFYDCICCKYEQKMCETDAI
jgi:hypothetical protein